MQLSHRLMLTGLPFAVIATPAAAQSVELSITIPRLNVAEYHRPYVAIWLEVPGKPARTVAIWYDLKLKNNEGQKWLRDVRQWWRASGRTLKLPADGVSGATRAPGANKLVLTAGQGALAGVTPGEYTLVVEAAREAGGRELVRLPFAWPPRGGQSATGKTELGAITLSPRR